MPGEQVVVRLERDLDRLVAVAVDEEESVLPARRHAPAQKLHHDDVIAPRDARAGMSTDTANRTQSSRHECGSGWPDHETG